MTKEIHNRMDVIDSRDIIERINELQDEINAAREHAAEAWNEMPEADRDLSCDDFITAETDDALLSERAELNTLLALQEEAEGYSEDWHHGSTLVRESYWIPYIQDLINDIGDLPRGLPNYIEIDWEKTAQNIQIDYTSVDFDGITYWVR